MLIILGLILLTTLIIIDYISTFRHQQHRDIKQVEANPLITHILGKRGSIAILAVMFILFIIIYQYASLEQATLVTDVMNIGLLLLILERTLIIICGHFASS